PLTQSARPPPLPPSHNGPAATTPHENTETHTPVPRREGHAALAAAEPLGSHRPAGETLKSGRVDRERFENGGSHARRLRLARSCSRPRVRRRSVPRKLEILLDGGRFFEAPRWHDCRWYVSDFHRHVVQTVDEHGSAEVILEVLEQPSGLGWLPDGSLLVVSMRDHRLVRRWPGGRVTQHTDVSRFCGGFLNDMVVDLSGRAYVGNFGFPLDRKSRPTPTVLVRVDLDGSSSVVANDLLFPNGT